MYRNNHTSRKSQQGNVYIVAIFVIVVMGMLAMNLTRVSWSNQDTLTREVLGKQAALLARSGNEWAVTYLFPLDEDDGYASLSTRCGSLGSSAVDASKALVENADIPCHIKKITCTESPTTTPVELKYIQISTRAVCDSGNVFEVEREQTVWVRGIKDE
ncbi:hypothetical protein [Vibrio rarus]|uniref:hypothetical protein n=1 Tax=Vibrio rarus TaxID=413403 RepID=UPI0021C43C52|nr:hypothetical protein [Vibrio rarus]